VLGGRPFRGVNLWPPIPGFRATVLAYYDAAWALGRHLHRAVAVDLGLDPDYFEEKLDRPLATLRLLHYPPRPASPAPDELGAGEHTDYGNLTLLLTDEVGGLEVRRRDGEWLSVPFAPGALICNIGDCLMRWTNDVYVSTPHRVVSPPGRERYSIAFFLDANPDAVVECLKTCRGAGERYPPIAAADYLRARLDATYAPRQPGGMEG
jgi:isopenicillin N synthase-like dioxygenase